MERSERKGGRKKKKYSQRGGAGQEGKGGEK